MKNYKLLKKLISEAIQETQTEYNKTKVYGLMLVDLIDDKTNKVYEKFLAEKQLKEKKLCDEYYHKIFEIITDNLELSQNEV